MESTLLLAFIRGAKLRHWLGRPDCPNILRSCKRLFDDIYAPSTGTSAADSVPGELASGPSIVPDDLRGLVKARSVVIRARITLDGVVYARSSTHPGNSHIMYHPNGDFRSPAVPGIIKYIYESENRFCIAVRRRLPVHRDVIDPYREYPEFGAQLYSSQCHPDLEVVETGELVGHYAAWQMNPDLVVVKPLSLVCSIFNCVMYTHHLAHRTD